MLDKRVETKILKMKLQIYDAFLFYLSKFIQFYKILTNDKSKMKVKQGIYF